MTAYFSGWRLTCQGRSNRGLPYIILPVPARRLWSTPPPPAAPRPPLSSVAALSPPAYNPSPSSLYLPLSLSLARVCLLCLVQRRCCGEL
uniref:Uncharacterized protein n=1 Tax=Physcomitrium patens TaxID=3218 RepID=A0A7I3YW82_PHYPA